MERDAFEQLLSNWLDEPQRADLRAEIDRAAADSAELQALRGKWERLGTLLRAPAAPAHNVNWVRVQEHVLAGIADASPDLEAVDGLLARLGPIDARVDWPRMSSRIRTAIETEGVSIESALATLPPIEGRVDWQRFKLRISDSTWRGAAIRRARRWVLPIAATTSLAAAAALAFLFWSPFSLMRPGADPALVARADVVAQISVFRETDSFVQAADDSSPGVERGSSDTPDVFLMIEPPAVAAAPANDTIGF